MCIAEAAVAALQDAHALADLGQVGDQHVLVGVVDFGADRNLEHGVGALGAGTVLAHAVDAGLGLEMLLIAIVEQRVEARHAERDHVAAAAAVAAVGAAEFDELLAPERDAAGAAGTGLYINLGFVEKFHGVVGPIFPSLRLRGEGQGEGLGDWLQLSNEK